METDTWRVQYGRGGGGTREDRVNTNYHPPMLPVLPCYHVTDVCAGVKEGVWEERRGCGRDISCACAFYAQARVYFIPFPIKGEIKRGGFTPP